MGWPAPHPQAPEIAFSYYYYIYSWPAALTSWLGISLWAGWWVTAVVVSTVGGLLILDFLRVPVRSWWMAAIMIVLVINGASFLVVISTLLHMPPKMWGGEEMRAMQHAFVAKDLYLWLPQIARAYWAPFAVLAGGVLFQTLQLLLQQWRHRPSPPRALFCMLAIGSLAGYCTFHLLGFLLIIIPLLLWVLVYKLPTEKRWRAVGLLAVIGLVSALLSMPILAEFAQRAPGVRDIRFVPLLEWLQHSSAVTAPTLMKLALFIAGIWAFNNPLGVAALFMKSRTDHSLQTWICQGIFLWGSVVCLFGVVNEFGPKFGSLVFLAGIFVFLQRAGQSRRWRIFLALAVVSSALTLANNIRANFAVAKLDKVWRVIDRECEGGKIPVYYDVTAKELESTSLWIGAAPLFARAQFFIPAGEIDDTGYNFLRIPEQQKHLGDTLNRLRTFYPHAEHYLLLSKPRGRLADRPLLYQGGVFLAGKLPLKKEAP